MYDWLDEYLLANLGAMKDYKIEWEWYRYLVNDKMFAATLKLDKPSGIYQARPILTVKCEPAFSDIMRAQYPEDILPGFYMNKVHWNSIYLDGSVPDDVVRTMCDMSYKLIFGSLTKKAQKEIVDSSAK